MGASLHKLLCSRRTGTYQSDTEWSGCRRRCWRGRGCASDDTERPITRILQQSGRRVSCGAIGCDQDFEVFPGNRTCPIVTSTVIKSTCGDEVSVAAGTVVDNYGIATMAGHVIAAPGDMYRSVK